MTTLRTSLLRLACLFAAFLVLLLLLLMLLAMLSEPVRACPLYTMSQREVVAHARQIERTIQSAAREIIKPQLDDIAKRDVLIDLRRDAALLRKIIACERQ